MTLSFTPEQLERIKLWEQELLNPDRIQGTGRLAYTDGGVDKFCCLGIACEVAIANGLEVKRSKIKGVEGGMTIHQYDGQSDHIPPSVAAWYGFTDIDRHNPQLRYVDPEGREVRANAAAFNDGDAGLDDRLPFPEIAAAVRHTYLENVHDQDPELANSTSPDTQTQA